MADDGVRELEFPDRFTGSERVILVPGPLPVSWIESIIFRSADDKWACEADAKDFGNVPLEDFKPRRFRKALFAKAPSVQWPPAEGPRARTVPLQQPLAVGGVMAMLLRFANLGDQAVRACRVAFDPDDGAPRPAEDHPILAGLRSWVGGRGGVAADAPGFRVGSSGLAEHVGRRGSSGRPSNVWWRGATPAPPAVPRMC